MIPNLVKSRHGTYYLRLQRGGIDIRRSLRTKDLKTAKIYAHLFNLFIMSDDSKKNFSVEELKNIRKLDIELPDGTKVKNVNTEEDRAFVRELMNMRPDPVDGLAPISEFRRISVPIDYEEPRAASPKGKPYLETTEAYLKEKKLDNAEKTIYDKGNEYARFVELYGNLNMGEITKETVLSYKQRLLAEGKSASVINKMVTFQKDFFQWAINNNRYFSANPYDGMKVSKKGKLAENVEHYLPFTHGDLKRIFDPTTYKEYAIKPNYRYIPFIMMYSGARPEEIASLKTEQIMTDEETGVVYFDIRRENTKNKNGIRKIPMHSKILESSFMEYLDRQRKRKSIRLFSELTKSYNGYSRNISRHFNPEYLDKVLSISAPKRLYSFRHTVINQLTNQNINPALVMALVGHMEQKKLEQIDLSSPHFKNYQSKKPLGVLKETCEKISYPLDIRI